jgi:alkanesulfonate monooxygenase SsuD/methylene tetrahydromethanopterin reductase-like flavin-dependent oxidoreductase (luciferase family)
MSALRDRTMLTDMPEPTSPPELEVPERPFRFAVVAGGLPLVAGWTALAARVEAAGFDTLLVPDNLDGPAPLIAAAVAAVSNGAGSSLRTGTFVAVAGLRPPAVLAWEAATVTEMTGGRFDLGLGLGRPDADADAARLGLDLPPAGRLAGLRAVLAAVRELPDHRRPPVLVAAGGPRMLRLAGEEADIVALASSTTASPDDLARSAGAVRWAARERPRPPELAFNLMLAGDGEPPPWLSARLGVDPAALRAGGAAVVLAGSPAQMADTLLRRREETGISYISGGLHLLEALAPVVERLAGR